MKKSKPTTVRRRYPLNAVFVIYCMVSLLVAVGAFNANNNLLFWLFGLSLGMLLVSGVVSGTMMMAISVRRLPVEQARVGEAVRIRYAVTNRSRWLPAIGIHLAERLEPTPPEPDPLAQSATLSAPPSGAIPFIPRNATVVVETLATPTRRGRLRLAGFDALTTFPFGIIRKSLSYADPLTLIVHPAEIPLPSEIINARTGLLGAGTTSKRPGRLGDEPIGLREYTPGDPPKLVSWRASAKRPDGTLLVRQNAEGSPRRAYILLRLEGVASPAQTERAIASAASVIRLASAAGYRTGLSIRGDWPDSTGRPLATDLPPRGGAGMIVLNDLSLLPIPTGEFTPLPPAGEPRLSAADLVVRISPDGTLDVSSTRPGRRPATTRSAGGAA